MVKMFVLIILITIFCSNSQCIKNNYSTIIIGAGPSGIAAASRLLENNYTDFVILEAEGRIGGRIFSVPFGDAIIDIGAEWCHGQEGNVVYQKLKNLNILKHYDEKHDRTQIFYSKFPVSKNFTDTIYEFYETIAHEKDLLKKLSLQEHFLERYNESITKFYANNSTLTQLASDTSDVLLRALCSYEGCFNASYVSTSSNFKESAGDQNMHFNGKGYKTFLDVLMKRYPDPKESLPIDERVLLNKEVINIKWSENQNDTTNNFKVAVKCLDGQTYFSDQVIVTVSIGVLKEKHKSLFDPALPDNKISAIENIGFDAVAKVFLLYEDKWWSDDFKFAFFVWSQEEKEKLFKNDLGWILDFFSTITYDVNKYVLCFWISGNNVPRIETKSDEDIKFAVKYILKTFVNDQYNNQDPIKILRSKWYSNSHFGGTYSYDSVKMGVNSTSRRDLAEPLLNSISKQEVLLFAGEASHPCHFSTVHGATESGIREANRILK